MRTRFRKSQASCLRTVYVPQQRPHRNETEKLRRKVLRMKRWTERVLNIQPGDLGRGILFGVLAPTQVWTLANYLLTTREAKRIFGMVGGGAILGAIFAGYFSKTVAKAFGAESLLLGMASLLFICTVLMATMWHSLKSRLAATSETAAGDKGIGQRDLQGSMRLVLSSPYLRAIAAVICLASFVTTLTGWQFKAVAKQFLVNKDALAILFGSFYLYAGILGLLFQLLLTTRVLRRFGIGTMLFPSAGNSTLLP